MEISKYLFDIINGSVPEIVENNDISINYVMNEKILNQNEVNIDETFSYNIAMNVMSDNEDQEAMIIFNKEKIDQNKKMQ